MATAREMNLITHRLNEVLRGKQVESIRIASGREKLTNADLSAYSRRAGGRLVDCAYPRGRWGAIQLEGGENLLFTHRFLSKIAYHEPGAAHMPGCDVLVAFADGSALAMKFPLGGRFFLADDPSLPKSKQKSRR